MNFVAKDADGAETFPALLGARQALQKIARFERALAEQAGVSDSEFDIESAKSVSEKGAFAEAFAALQNDLNTPDCLGQIFSAMKTIKPGELDETTALLEWKALRFVLEGLGLELPVEEEAAGGDIPEAIRAMADERLAAKQAKDWATSDRLRDEIAAAGWELKDTKEGYELCLKN